MNDQMHWAQLSSTFAFLSIFAAALDQGNRGSYLSTLVLEQVLLSLSDWKYTMEGHIHELCCCCSSVPNDTIKISTKIDVLGWFQIQLHPSFSSREIILLAIPWSIRIQGLSSFHGGSELY